MLNCLWEGLIKMKLKKIYVFYEDNKTRVTVKSKELGYLVTNRDVLEFDTIMNKYGEREVIEMMIQTNKVEIWVS